MQFNSIADVYAANEQILTNFRELVSDISDDEASAPAKDQKWTIAEIVEHVAMVDGGMTKICSRLLSKAQADGLPSNGNVSLSSEFVDKSVQIAGIKVEAPEMVHPVGGRSIADSMAAIEEIASAVNEMRPLFESVDSVTHKFPHPFFGDLSAAEWLVLLGGHRARHSAQIRRRIAEIRA